MNDDVANAEKQEFHRGSFTAPHVDLGLEALACGLPDSTATRTKELC